jgi:hypothetical protein
VLGDRYEAGGCTWVSCLGIALVFWPLMCVPFCVNDLKDAYHECPHCRTPLGTRPACQ